MPHEKLKPHFVFDEQRLNELKQIAPEAFADGKINWDTLKESLGEYTEDDRPDTEHFGLFWPGKREARKLASIPSKGTLVPLQGEGIDEENTGNIFIEGENMEVLKLLQKSYAGKIKMIYIDPPYNTGKDFVYEDDFTEPLEEYLKRTGQLDDEGKAMSTNTGADGRFHSKWLSMMYPRLRLARNLLKDNGVIFVSIDDNEVHNLRAIMNEIFGEENFVGQWNWFKSATPPNLSLKIKKNIEYVLAFEKIKTGERYTGIRKYSSSDDPITKPQNTIKELTFPAKSLEIKFDDCVIKPGVYGTDKYPNQLLNSLVVKNKTNEKEVSFKNRFVWTQDKLVEELEKNTIVRINSKSLVISYKKADYGEELPPNFIDEKVNVGTTEEAGKQLTKLMDNMKVFDYPKPINLIQYLINFIVEDDEYILDFFAGSASTGHAIFEDNKLKNFSRKFILVQIPEPLDEKNNEQQEAIKYCKQNKLERKLSAISKERLKRIIKVEKYAEGFKVFKLTTSNYKQWKNYEGQSIDELEKQFDLFETPLIDGWKEENLLSEIVLIEGFPLDSKTHQVKEQKKNKVIQVSSDFCEHKLLVCLDKKVKDETIASLKFEEGDIFICLDSAITDQEKVRLSDKGLIKTI